MELLDIKNYFKSCPKIINDIDDDDDDKTIF